MSVQTFFNQLSISTVSFFEMSCYYSLKFWDETLKSSIFFFKVKGVAKEQEKMQQYLYYIKKKKNW